MTDVGRVWQSEMFIVWLVTGVLSSSSSPSQPSQPPPPPPPSCPNTCLGAPEYANDGQCDDGGPLSFSSVCAFGALCAGCNPLLTFALSLAPALTYESESAPHAQLLEVRGEGRVVGQAVRGRAGAGRRRMEGPFKMGDDKTRCAYCISGDEDSVHCAVCTSV